MCKQSPARPRIQLGGQTVRTVVMCFLAAIFGGEAAAQSFGFVPAAESGLYGFDGDFSGRARELDAYLERYPKDRNHKFIEAKRDLAKKIASRKASSQ